MVYHLDQEDFLNALNEHHEKLIIDVRSKDEFQRNHFVGALNIDIMSPLAIDEFVKLEQGIPCFVYCHIGVRSRSACKLLTSIGFNEIYHLKKGIQQWTGEIEGSES